MPGKSFFTLLYFVLFFDKSCYAITYSSDLKFVICKFISATDWYFLCHSCLETQGFVFFFVYRFSLIIQSHSKCLFYFLFLFEFSLSTNSSNNGYSNNVFICCFFVSCLVFWVFYMVNFFTNFMNMLISAGDTMPTSKENMYQLVFYCKIGSLSSYLINCGNYVISLNA